jgi:hypothetical protein
MTRTWVIVLALAGCGGSSTERHDDAAIPIDAPVAIDAPVDAAKATPATQLTAAGGRISGGAYTMDVELGTGLSQAPTAGAGKTFQADTAVKP